MMPTYSIVVLVGAIVLGLASMAGGIVCIVRYARTRKVPWLIVGLLLTLIVPGLVVCGALVFWIPTTMMAYGPPPTMMVYGPPPTLNP
jgi:hypothetical protein